MLQPGLKKLLRIAKNFSVETSDYNSFYQLLWRDYRNIFPETTNRTSDYFIDGLIKSLE